MLMLLDYCQKAMMVTFGLTWKVTHLPIMVLALNTCLGIFTKRVRNLNLIPLMLGIRLKREQRLLIS